MRRYASGVLRALCAVLCAAGANCVYFLARFGAYGLAPAAAALFSAGLFLTMLSGIGISGARLFFLNWGSETLKCFVICLCISAAYHIVLLFVCVPQDMRLWLISAGVCAAALAFQFWVGIITVYCLSLQLGIKQRLLGILCGMIPVLHLIMLRRIVRLCSREVGFETYRQTLDKSREGDKVCRTKYPLLFVHGVFFRDFKHINYWGRITAALRKNGAVIYYGDHQSAASVSDSGKELADRIRLIVAETGCEKLNVIAHSKGGLDMRSALCCGAAPYVASLTTINTPHRGCEFADYLLKIAPCNLKQKLARTYNRAARVLGDRRPDFLAAVDDLTAEKCKKFDAETPVPQGIYCRGVMSKMKKACGGKFPLNFTYKLAKYFDGDGDGLVSVESARWGEDFVLVEPEGERGISHGDIIDLNRENIPGFDVREFYVGLVSDLKARGL